MSKEMKCSLSIGNHTNIVLVKPASRYMVKKYGWKEAERLSILKQTGLNLKAHG